LKSLHLANIYSLYGVTCLFNSFAEEQWSQIRARGSHVAREGVLCDPLWFLGISNN